MTTSSVHVYSAFTRAFCGRMCVRVCQRKTGIVSVTTDRAAERAPRRCAQHCEALRAAADAEVTAWQAEHGAGRVQADGAELRLPLALVCTLQRSCLL